MGKYMRKRKGVGEVAVMDITQQGTMGVRTRARTLALEQDRKLAQQAQNSGDQQQLQDEVEEVELQQQQEEVEVVEKKGQVLDAEEPPEVVEQVQSEAPQQQKQSAVDPLPTTSYYLLRSRKLEKSPNAAPDRDGNIRKRTSPEEVRVVGEESRLKRDGGAKFKRYSRMRPADAAVRNPSDVEGSNEAGGGSGGRILRHSTRGRTAGAGKAPLSEHSGTKRKANTRSNATSLPRNRNNKVPKIPVPEAEEATIAAAAAAAGGVVVAAEAAASPVPAAETLDPELDVVDGHSPQPREDADASEGQHPKSLEVEASFGDNAFCDNAMEQDRFSAKDSEISRPSTRSRNVRESTPSSYSRDQEGDAPEACSRLPTPQDGGSWRPCSRRRLFEAPSATELDDFFTAAEGREHLRFAERYNFDPVTDVPLPGRFEWVKVEESKAASTAAAAAAEASPVLPQEPGA